MYCIFLLLKIVYNFLLCSKMISKDFSKVFVFLFPPQNYSFKKEIENLDNCCYFIMFERRGPKMWGKTDKIAEHKCVKHKFPNSVGKGEV